MNTLFIVWIRLTPNCRVLLHHQRSTTCSSFSRTIKKCLNHSSCICNRTFGVTFWRQSNSRLVLIFIFCFGGDVLGFVLFLLSPLTLKKCHRILNRVNLTEKSWTQNDLCWIKAFYTRNVLAHIVPWKLQVLLEKNATVDTLKPILRWFAVMQIYTKRWKDNADRCDIYTTINFFHHSSFVANKYFNSRRARNTMRLTANLLFCSTVLVYGVSLQFAK